MMRVSRCCGPCSGVVAVFQLSNSAIIYIYIYMSRSELLSGSIKTSYLEALPDIGSYPICGDGAGDGVQSEWELVAAICAVRCLIQHGLAECEVVLFVDCNPALHALVRGASRQSDLNEVITGFWFAVARAGVLLHAFRAPSKLNIADGPTRQETWDRAVSEFHSRGFRQLQWMWPPALPWSI
ncbi:unnamed protein product [Prorocentrum cordatum]|uniref:RNase H type-1 domain-containing protein n=1 Tax=Prorocentrum cordatum TaxID=2364126 RepID=A0ABN9V1K8_9DINO|nr:unnamed protein product [Polarella glacialis]